MTDRDLRGSFLMAFGLGVVSCFGELFGLVRYREMELATSWWAALLIPVGTRVLVSGAFLVAGLSLAQPKVPGAVSGNGRWILRLLQVSGLILALTGVHALAVLGSEVWTAHLRTVLALAITGLLYVATKRRYLARTGGR